MSGGWGEDEAAGGARVRWLADDPRFSVERRWRPTACGVLEVTADVADACAAEIMRRGSRVPVTVRFGQAADGLPADLAARHAQAFDVRFGEGEGVWDLPGLNMPVAWTSDRRRPGAVAVNDHDPTADAFWSEVASRPIMVHRLLWTLSDWALPRSLRMMDGFSATPLFVTNADGRPRLARFHWRSRLGPQALLAAEVKTLRAVAGDYLHRDLFETMSAGDAAVWFLGMQVFEEDLAEGADGARVVPEATSPVRVVGRMTLETCPERDLGESLLFDPGRRPAGLGPPPPAVAHGDPHEQPRLLWRSWTESEQAHVVEACGQAWGRLQPRLQQGLLEALWPVDDDLSSRVAAKLGADPPAHGRRRRGRLPADDAPDPALSIQRRMRPSLESRVVGLLVADGADGVQVRMTLDDIEQAGAYALVLSCGSASLLLAEGERLQPDATLEATPAALLDALGVLAPAGQARVMTGDPRVPAFLRELYAQLKCVAFAPESAELILAAGLDRRPGVVGLDRLVSAGGRRYFDRETAPLPERP